MNEILGWISLALSCFVLILSILLFIRVGHIKPSDNLNIESRLMNSFNLLTMSTNTSILELNKNLHEVLHNNALSSNEAIVNMRLNINEEMQKYKENFEKLGIGLSEVLQNNNKLSTQELSEMKLNLNNEMLKFRGEFEKRIGEAFISVGDQLEKKLTLINEKVDGKLNEGFEKTNKTFNDIVLSMAQIEAAKTSIEKLNTGVNDLQSVLNNNQQRGAFGEFQLLHILRNVFGDQGKLYDVQYTIKENENEMKRVRADAVVFMKQPNCLICIDSKFPFSSYASYMEEKNMTLELEKKYLSGITQEVKKHIQDVSNKYIIYEVTADYALMFIPSDGLLSLLHAKCPELIEYSISKNVVIVSPTTIVPTLFSYRVMINDAKRNEFAREISESLNKLSKDFGLFSERWQKMIASINGLQKQSSDVNISVLKIEKKFSNLNNNEIEEIKSAVMIGED